MNVSNQPNIDVLIAAARDQFDDEQIAQSAVRVNARLPATRTPRQPRGMGWYATAGVSLLVVSLLVGPHWFADSGGAAVARALKWFESYTNMRVTMIFPSTDGTELSSQLYRDDRGFERREVSRGEFLLISYYQSGSDVAFDVLPGNRVMERAVTDREIEAGGSAGAAILSRLISFQGEAARMEESREEGGRTLIGYQLLGDGNIVTRTLWIDSENNMPVRFVSSMPDGDVGFEFDFDLDLPPDFFDVPDGAHPEDQ